MLGYWDEAALSLDTKHHKQPSQSSECTSWPALTIQKMSASRWTETKQHIDSFSCTKFLELDKLSPPARKEIFICHGHTTNTSRGIKQALASDASSVLPSVDKKVLEPEQKAAADELPSCSRTSVRAPMEPESS